MWLFYLASYLSAFLLFMIQPILTKALLPTFGGSYLVWGAAMVFFQGALLLGYLLSHVSQAQWGVRRYGKMHLFLLFLPLITYPFRFAWDVEAVEFNLAISVFHHLLLGAGAPFLALSMTSLILQRWLMFSPLRYRKNPYVLYAASNTGSVSALLAYPLLIEPISTIEQQVTLWWCGYILLALLHWFLYPWRTNENVVDLQVETKATDNWNQRIRWFLLSLATGTMLLATTNVITFDLAAIPLLWVLPLTLFMLAYVVSFKHVPWFPKWMHKALNWCVLLGACLVLLLRLRIILPPGVMLLLYLAVLFVICVNCNMCLVKSKPDTGVGLTRFYVVLALGGLCGSLLVSWVLPPITHSLLEYPLGLLLTVVAIGFAKQEQRFWHMLVPHGIGLAVLAGLFFVVPRLITPGYPEIFVFLAVSLPVALLLRLGKDFPVVSAGVVLLLIMGGGQLDRFARGGDVVDRHRNYYGIYHIYDRDNVRYLQHGTTHHGSQHLDPELRSTPLGYYHPTTPAVDVLQTEGDELQDIGMLGLGTGAFTIYGQEGQNWSIFELDPDNLVLAEKHFDYLEQARARGLNLRFVFGDGRRRISQEPDASYDVIIMDAFNSGAIPVHLLTTQAIEDYLEKLRPDGVLLLHLSNRVLDLVPVAFANAAELDIHALALSNQRMLHPDANLTVWVAMSRDEERMQEFRRRHGWINKAPRQLPRPWTDQYSNLPAAIRWF